VSDDGPPGECQCPDARKWRAYWTADAIAERLREEVELYRRIIRDAVWWGGSTSPVPPRVDAAMSNVEMPDSHAAKERLRREPKDWRTRQKLDPPTGGRRV
jgi:hypothetical protein